MNVARDTTGVAPRGSTKVRRAESNTRSTNVIPRANHRTAVTTCMAVQLGRRPPIASSASFARQCDVADDARTRSVVSRHRRGGGAVACAATGAVWRRAAPLWPTGSVRSPAAAGRPASAAAKRERSRSRASSRLRACERLSDAVARATGPSLSSSRARCRGPSEVDVAIGNRTSTRVSDVLACWPPGPPEPVVRHSSSSRRITHVGVIRNRARSVAGSPSRSIASHSGRVPISS